jgi:hypothetical protein
MCSVHEKGLGRASSTWGGREMTEQKHVYRDIAEIDIILRRCIGAESGEGTLLAVAQVVEQRIAKLERELGRKTAQKRPVDATTYWDEKGRPTWQGKDHPQPTLHSDEGEGCDQPEQEDPLNLLLKHGWIFSPTRNELRELLADKARLDWMEERYPGLRYAERTENGQFFVRSVGPIHGYRASTLRVAIDAAREDNDD